MNEREDFTVRTLRAHGFSMTEAVAVATAQRAARHAKRPATHHAVARVVQSTSTTTRVRRVAVVQEHSGIAHPCPQAQIDSMLIGTARPQIAAW